MSEELKVVLTQRRGKTAVGVQSEGCDPVVSVLPGDMEQALDRVSDLVDRARARWQQSPRYPKSERVVPAPPVRASAPAGQSSTKPAPKKAEPQPQSKLF